MPGTHRLGAAVTPLAYLRAMGPADILDVMWSLLSRRGRAVLGVMMMVVFFLAFNVSPIPPGNIARSALCRALRWEAENLTETALKMIPTTTIGAGARTPPRTPPSTSGRRCL